MTEHPSGPHGTKEGFETLLCVQHIWQRLLHPTPGSNVLITGWSCRACFTPLRNGIRSQQPPGLVLICCETSDSLPAIQGK